MADDGHAQVFVVDIGTEISNPALSLVPAQVKKRDKVRISEGKSAHWLGIVCQVIDD